MNTIFKVPIDKLRTHHRAEEIPTMDPDQYDALVADIEKRGIQVPLDVLPMQDADGRYTTSPGDASEVIVLDGRHRLRAAAALGIEEIDVREVETVFWHTGSEDKDGHTVTECEAHQFDYMLRAATQRRHLSPSQRKDLAAKLLKLEPQLSDRLIAKQVGVSHPTVAKVRAGLEEVGDVERVSTRTDSAGRKQPAAKSTAWRGAYAPPTPEQTRAHQAQLLLIELRVKADEAAAIDEADIEVMKARLDAEHVAGMVTGLQTARDTIDRVLTVLR